MGKHTPPHWQDDGPLELIPDSCDPPTPGTVLRGYLGRGGECGCDDCGCDCECGCCGDRPDVKSGTKAAKVTRGAKAESECTCGCEETVRLYQSLDLDSYYEIRGRDVKRALSSPDGWGPSMVRVRKGATVRLVQTFAAGVSSPYLRGGIADGHLAGARLGGGDDPPHTPWHPCSSKKPLLGC